MDHHPFLSVVHRPETPKRVKKKRDEPETDRLTGRRRRLSEEQEDP
jgi:hypothetical protein